MALSRVTPPSTWPVTLAEAKAQCRVRHSDEDTYITQLYKSATSYVEKSLGMSISEQVWELTLDEFSDTVELTMGPVASIDSIEYVDLDGIAQPLDPAIYTADIAGPRYWVLRNSDEDWPETMSAANAVAITYTTGMDPVPDDLKHAILFLIGSWYNNREAVAEKVPSAVPLAFEALMENYRMVIVP